jgi:hypothetical protein
MNGNYPPLTGEIKPQKPSKLGRNLGMAIAVAAVVVIIIIAVALKTSFNNPIIGDWRISPNSNFFINLLSLGSSSNMRIKITRTNMIISHPIETTTLPISFAHENGRWFIIADGDRSEVVILDENTIVIKSDGAFLLGGVTLIRAQ